MAGGFPNLLGKIATAGNIVSLLSADVQRVLSLFRNETKWGIGVNGTFVITPDEVISVEVKNDNQVSNYPQEDGAFQSYNKVNTPYDVKIRMAKAGEPSVLTKFLNDIALYAGTTLLVDVVTPAGTYKSMNVTHYDYRQTTTNGASMLTVDVWLLEVRVTASQQFTQNVSAPSAQSPSTVGTVQAQTSNQSALASLAR